MGDVCSLTGREFFDFGVRPGLSKVQVCLHPAQAVHHLQGILAYAAHQQIPFVEVIQQKPLDQVEAHHMAGRGHMGSGAGTGVKLTANGNVAFVHIVNGYISQPPRMHIYF